MTISSPEQAPHPEFSASGLDLAAFGLHAADLVSLRSLGDIWRRALASRMMAARGDRGLLEFLAVAEKLPYALADSHWQQEWVSGWHKLISRGYTQTDVFRLFFEILMQCENDLLGESGSVSRVIIDLFTCLRRAVLAAVIGMIDLSAAARGEHDDIQDELAALRQVRERLAGGELCGLLSVSAVNREAFTSLPAADLQQIPHLLAEHIAAHLRPEDQLFTGRDNEWLVLLGKLQTPAQVLLAATQISRTFETPLPLLSGRRVSIHATLGCAALPEHAGDAENALKAARLARWQARQEKQSCAWYEPSLGERWQQREQLLAPLQAALAQDQFELYLQPQVDLADGRCIDAELLLRWQHQGQFVAPPEIIELIESNGWRTQYTDWLLRTALRTLSELDAAGIDIGVSINLTAADLLDADLPELLAQRLSTWRLPGSRLTLELTESAFLHERSIGLANMERLRALGCRLALDDFGTGYSSLSYLVTLPVQEIKIDRSFVVAMEKSADARRVVRTIVDLASDLGMLPIAEGVEHDAAHAAVSALGCQVGQGYLYGKPMPLDDFIAWYRAR
jgi:EAL domain-containing protein (putative c-di-GMP-specific phosphodiesterase class I)